MRHNMIHRGTTGEVCDLFCVFLCIELNILAFLTHPLLRSFLENLSIDFFQALAYGSLLRLRISKTNAWVWRRNHTRAWIDFTLTTGSKKIQIT